MDAKAERWLLIGLAALALALGAYNAWSLSAIAARLDEVEIEAAEAAAARTDTREARPSRSAWGREPRYDRDAAPERFAARSRGETSGGAAGVASLDPDDPAFAEKVASVMEAEEERRDAERRARFEESVRAEIESFAEEEGLDDATTTALLAQVATRSDAFRSIRDDVREGTLTWSEGRAEMEALREEGEAETVRLIGEERAERLQARLWGDRPGPGGGGGPWR